MIFNDEIIFEISNDFSTLCNNIGKIRLGRYPVKNTLYI